MLKFPNQYVMLDIETTGLHAKNNEIIEIGAVKVVNGHIVDQFNRLIKPKRSIPPFITQLTGITNEMVQSEASCIDVLSEFLLFIQDNILIGHNVKFDMNFINYAFEQELGIFLENEVLDNLQYARKYLPQLSHHKLSDCVQHFNLYHENAHRAIDDAIATYEVFEKLRDIALKDKPINKEDDVFELHKKLFSSEYRNDGYLLSTLLTKDYVEINSQGILYHYEIMDTFSSCECDQWHIDDYDVIYKTSTLIQTIFVLNQITRKCRCTTIWKKTKGQWKCSFMQLTKL